MLTCITLSHLIIIVYYVHTYFSCYAWWVHTINVMLNMSLFLSNSYNEFVIVYKLWDWSLASSRLAKKNKKSTTKTVYRYVYT